MKKYELLTNDSIVNEHGVILYRIKALKDFGIVKAGDLGGYIEKENNLSHNGDAWVYGNAWVWDNAWVSGNAKVYGDAEIWGNTKVYGDAEIWDNAWVSGNAKVYGNAKVSGNAWVYGDAEIWDNAWVSGNAKVYGNAKVCGNALVSDNNDYACIKGFGSQNRSTTFFMQKNNTIGVKCGCFYGTLEEFRDKVKETHKDTYYAKEYLMIADLMEIRFNNRNMGKL